MNQQTNANLIVLTTTEVDEYSGAREEQAADTAVPAVVIERSRRTEDPVTGSPRTVRYITVKLPPDTAVTGDDRLRDADSGTEYAIQDIHRHATAGWAGDIVCDVVRLDNTQP